MFCLISRDGKKRYDIENLLMDGILNKGIFMKNHAEKCTPKASSKFHFNFCK